MPGETHQVGYDDSVSASFQTSRACYGVEAARGAALPDRAVDGDTPVHRSSMAGEGFGDHASWSEIDLRLTDLVMLDAVPMAAALGPEGRGGR